MQLFLDKGKIPVGKCVCVCVCVCVRDNVFIPNYYHTTGEPDAPASAVARNIHALPYVLVNTTLRNSISHLCI